MESYRIRMVERDDMHGLIVLCEKHAAHEGVSFDLRNKVDILEKQLFDPRSGVQCLVVLEAGVLVGYATYVKQFSTWDAGFYLYLDCLYLESKMRGRGIGKELMYMIKQYSDEHQCIGVQWQTPDFNEDAIKFYQNLGAMSKTKERFFW